jgi:hypothetical protein
VLGIFYMRRLNEGQPNEVLLLETPAGPVLGPAGYLGDLEQGEQPKSS